MLDGKLKTMKGLNFTKDTERKLQFNGNNNDAFVLFKKDCFKYFYPALSMAKFLNEYLSTTKTLYDIRDTLVGLKVHINTASGREDCVGS